MTFRYGREDRRAATAEEWGRHPGPGYRPLLKALRVVMPWWLADQVLDGAAVGSGRHVGRDGEVERPVDLEQATRFRRVGGAQAARRLERSARSDGDRSHRLALEHVAGQAANRQLVGRDVVV